MINSFIKYMNKICILFAGVVGCSKTPTANFLSTKLNLPVLNNDAIRTEVSEDLGFFDEKEYLKRRNERIKYIIENNISFIYDASVDREWESMKKIYPDKYGYSIFIISINLSKEFIAKIYKAKNYSWSSEIVDKFILDHEIFLNNNKEDVGLNISENEFNNRLQLSLEATKKWIDNLNN